MIEMLYMLLVLSMAFVNKQERLTSAIFTAFTLLFYFLNNYISSPWYYFSAACYDVLMMAVMIIFFTSTNQKMTIYLSIACFISILIQLAGYKIYVIEGNGIIYDYMAYCFYIGVIILFISRKRLNGRFARNTSHTRRFLRDNFRRV